MYAKFKCFNGLNDTNMEDPMPARNKHLISWWWIIKCSEKCAPWSVRTSSLYFHKARALRHTSALLRYNAGSLRHRYERAQFTIHSIKEIKKTCSSSIVALYRHLRIFRYTREVLLRTRFRLVLLRTSLVKFPTCSYNSTMHSALFLFL